MQAVDVGSCNVSTEPSYMRARRPFYALHRAVRPTSQTSRLSAEQMGPSRPSRAVRLQGRQKAARVRGSVWWTLELSRDLRVTGLRIGQPRLLRDVLGVVIREMIFISDSEGLHLKAT